MQRIQRLCHCYDDCPSVDDDMGSKQGSSTAAI
eukprot:COSAG04_NODE_32080_length_253_cov_0.668831_1_plen_32_part_10